MNASASQLEGPVRDATHASDPLAWTYLSTLSEGLEQEATRAVQKQRIPREHVLAVRRLRDDLSRSAESPSFGTWRAFWARYHALARRMGSLLNDSGTVATSYDSMDDFWRDMREQEQGRSDTTVW